MIEKLELIQEAKRALREKRRIKFIGYMRKLGKKAKYVRVE